MVLPEEVDDLLAVPSGRRLAFPAAARHAEPLRILDEQVSETTDVAFIDRGKRLPKAVRAVAHQPEDTTPGNIRMRERPTRARAIS